MIMNQKQRKNGSYSDLAHWLEFDLFEGEFTVLYIIITSLTLKKGFVRKRWQIGEEAISYES